jgi:hypothetical protein
MHTEITEIVSTSEEIRQNIFSDAFLNRQLRSHELGEIYFFCPFSINQKYSKLPRLQLPDATYTKKENS